MKLLSACAALVLLLLSTPAVAGEPAEAVRYFYKNIGSETDAENRDRFTDPARSVLETNDRNSDADEVGCIDFILAVDAQDLDEEEVGRTLALAETVTGDSAEVVATFKLFNEPRRLDWSLKKVGGAWKIADIASQASDWRLSKFDCGKK